jgi:hypothetical protein
VPYPFREQKMALAMVSTAKNQSGCSLCFVPYCTSIERTSYPLYFRLYVDKNLVLSFGTMPLLRAGLRGVFHLENDEGQSQEEYEGVTLEELAFYQDKG